MLNLAGEFIPVPQARAVLKIVRVSDFKFSFLLPDNYDEVPSRGKNSGADAAHNHGVLT